MTKTTRTAHLLATLIILAMLGLAALLIFKVQAYGDATTYNQGYQLGGDATELGLEVRGDPGVFYAVATPWGELSGGADAAGLATYFCPAGQTDIQCGA